MEVIEIKQADVLQAINKSEIDIQVATAKQYPRNIPDVLNKISTYATMDTETASDCFYVLRRSGSGGSTTVEGLSVRMAEIIAGAWGNLRVQTRIVGNDGRTITAQGICHDLETNVAVSVEVKRRITDKYGKTYSEDMQVVTGNAASAIAFRNAVLKVVPKAVTKRVIEGVKQCFLAKEHPFGGHTEGEVAIAHCLTHEEGHLAQAALMAIEEVYHQRQYRYYYY